MLTKDELPACSVATTIRLIGNKWKIFILQRLLDRPHGFGELRRSIDGISKKVLSDNLKALESDGIISKTITDDNPPRTEYSLTDTGNSMRPIIASMEEWGLHYQKEILEANRKSSQQKQKTTGGYPVVKGLNDAS